MELLLGLLAFGTGWFWGYLLIWFFLLTAFVENEKASWALFTTIVGLAGLVFLGNSGVIPWIIKNPLWAGAYIVGYVVVGIVWGFFKWGFYLSKIGGKYEDFKARWIKSHGAIDDQAWPNGRGTKREEFIREVRNAGLERPTAGSQKDRIIFWMSYWPSSALWTLLNDPLTHFFKFVYRRLSSMFEGMSKKMFAKYDNDFVAVVAEPAAGIDAIPPLPLETRTGRHPRGGVNGGHIG